MAEHGKLADLQVIGAAEELVAGARMVCLLNLQVTVKQRQTAARDQLSKAREAGDSDKIAAARRHCEAARAESDRASDEAIEEMFQITCAGTDRLDLIVDQSGRWQDAADAEFEAQLRAGQ
ncbi:hypothetical protein [Kribbella sancticallisti]|uniref:hypothetical protein n=1 Tax=Kribbella sancticallisti TaxID=460087 RepID=UPI0031D88975